MIVVFGLAVISGLRAQTFDVTSTGDHTSTVGELRNAINVINDPLSGAGPFTITFHIPSAGTPVTINLNSTLPPINGKTVYINGTTQSGYVQGNPTVIIDGSNFYNPASSAGTPIGLSFNSVTSGKVEGLYIRSFYDAVFFSFCTNCEADYNVINNNRHSNILIHVSSGCTAKGNYLNTDFNRTVFSVNSEEGIYFTNNGTIGSTNNLIGGTACGDGNTIMNTGSEGIDNEPNGSSRPVYNVNNHFTGNTIFNNTFDAIEIRSIANHNKPAPVIVTTGCTTSGTSEPNDVVELFGSSGLTSSKKNANVYMKTVTADGSGNWTVNFDFIEFPFITATATNSTNNTSELTPAIAITPSVLDFTYPSALCVGAALNFNNISTSCAGSFTFDWNYGDGSAITTSSTHTYSTVGTYNVTLFMHPNIYCKPYSITKTITISNCCPTCSPLDFTVPILCTNTAATFISTSTCPVGSPALQWNFDYTGAGVFGSSTTHTYTASGTYTVRLSLPSSSGCSEMHVDKTVTVSACAPDCINCIGSFAPEAGVYILSAWVKEDIATATTLTYPNPQIIIGFPTTSSASGTYPTVGPYTATGAIIDGWQRVEATFTIPTTATYINISLQCTGGGNCFFDDIRIFPKDGSMKSYVYDPVNLRLVAELDERNYATMYEYDEEGKLIRVKKETEKGIMTIKENRNSTKKKE